MDKNKVREYILHNFMPLVGHAITKSMKDGVVRDSHDLTHIQEEAVAGMMKALQSYKPGRGTFASYAMPTIMGAVKSAVASQEARHYIPHDKVRAQVEAKRTTEPSSQMVGSTATDPGVRAAMESAGGISSEEGAMTGVASDVSPAARFASQYRQYVDKVIRPKVETKEAEMKAPIKQAPAVQTQMPETKPSMEPSKPKTILRRDRLSPERQERLKNIDAAKMARGGSNDNK